MLGVARVVAATLNPYSSSRSQLRLFSYSHPLAQTTTKKPSSLPSAYEGTRADILFIAPVVPPTLSFSRYAKCYINCNAHPSPQRCSKGGKTTFRRLSCCMGATHLYLLATNPIQQPCLSLLAFFGQPLTRGFQTSLAMPRFHQLAALC